MRTRRHEHVARAPADGRERATMISAAVIIASAPARVSQARVLSSRRQSGRHVRRCICLLQPGARAARQRLRRPAFLPADFQMAADADGLRGMLPSSRQMTLAAAPCDSAYHVTRFPLPALDLFSMSPAFL